MIAPVLEEIAEEAGRQESRSFQAGTFDDNLEVGPGDFEPWMSIPTLIPVQGTGQPEVRLIGAKPKGQLLQEISAYL